MRPHAIGYLLSVSLLLLVLLTTAVACNQYVEQPTPVPAATEPPGTSPTPSSGVSSGDQPGEVITRAMEALSKSLDTDVSGIALVALERKEFPDASLDCPQPGEAAAAVVTPGYTAVLRAGDALYELHTNLDGTMIRCLPAGKPVVDIPDFNTPDATGAIQPSSTPLTPGTSQPGTTPFPTSEGGIVDPAVSTIADALKVKDYDRLREAIPGEFWLGFYASEATKMTPDEAVRKLRENYLGPGLVRVYPELSVDSLLPDWASGAPYARLVYSTGWGEGQKDDGILLFEEQAEELNWVGIFYIFDGLKGVAYGDRAAGLPGPPSQTLGRIGEAIEGKDYDALESLATTPVFLGFYASEASPLSPEAFVEALQRDYLEPGQVKVRFDVDVTRLLPDWRVQSPCDDAVYSTGWGENQADDAILCLRDESGTPRIGGLLYVFEHLKEIAYAEQPPEEDAAGEVEGMIYVPAGPFIMGSSASDVGGVQAECQGDPGCNYAQFEDETPQREVTLSAYYIDETEVTVAQFKEFVAATGYKTTSEAKGDPVQYTWRSFDTPDRQDHPVRWMSWHDARAYCQWAGKRLPTEAEWEKAARGTEAFKYPWGYAWDASRVPQGDTAPVAALPSGASPYGVLGMAGGVWEWVYDWYDRHYYQNGPTVDPTGPGETSDKVLRGGAFGNAAWKQRTVHRHFGGATGYAHDHGFRCAKGEESVHSP
jgi:formylglycine-generating enzyme required for sulfatase activity